jgi:hypothetical protein
MRSTQARTSASEVSVPASILVTASVAESGFT